MSKLEERQEIMQTKSYCSKSVNGMQRDLSSLQLQVFLFVDMTSYQNRPNYTEIDWWERRHAEKLFVYFICPTGDNPNTPTNLWANENKQQKESNKYKIQKTPKLPWYSWNIPFHCL